MNALALLLKLTDCSTKFKSSFLVQFYSRHIDFVLSLPLFVYFALIRMDVSVRYWSYWIGILTHLTCIDDHKVRCFLVFIFYFPSAHFSSCHFLCLFACWEGTAVISTSLTAFVVMFVVVSSLPQLILIIMKKLFFFFP